MGHCSRAEVQGALLACFVSSSGFVSARIGNHAPDAHVKYISAIRSLYTGPVTAVKHLLRAAIPYSLLGIGFESIMLFRDNDYSKAGSFQVSSMYLQETYAVSDFKICNGENCLGFDSIQCQTCESDEDQESSESAAYTTGDVSGKDTALPSSLVTHQSCCWHKGNSNEAEWW